MKYQIEDWVWTDCRKWKIMKTLYSARMVLRLYEHALELYEFFGKENLEQAKRELENEIRHLERAVELDNEMNEIEKNLKEDSR